MDGFDSGSRTKKGMRAIEEKANCGFLLCASCRRKKIIIIGKWAMSSRRKKKDVGGVKSEEVGRMEMERNRRSLLNRKPPDKPPSSYKHKKTSPFSNGIVSWPGKRLNG
jgi:hypothetical protein